MQGNGKVPMFKMRPNYGLLFAAVVMLIMGFLFHWQGHMDPGNIKGAQRSNLALVICIMLAGSFFILATSRMWFKHLWHDRYDRKGRMVDRGRMPERGHRR